MHLVPAQAGFWAAFLVPKTDSDRQRGLSELIAAWVGHSWGEVESIRHSAFIKDGLGCNAMLQPAGSAKAQADVRLSCEHRYVSRRDTEWVMWASVANEDLSPRAEENSQAGHVPTSMD